MTRQFNEGFKKHQNNERPIYINFAASKLAEKKVENTMVEFTDFMGRKHRVACRNNSDMKKAMTFFAVLKREATNINNIIAEYPIKMGRVEKKFIPAVKKDLKALGLSKKAIELVLA
jgi:hypothetical protein